MVMENVHEVTSVGPITGLHVLARLEGYQYRLRTAMLDPWQVAGVPMARDRQFWLLTRTD